MLRLGKNFRDPLDSTSMPQEGHIPVDQLTQGLTQSGLEHLQGWGMHKLPEQPVVVPHHPHTKEFLPNI